MPGPGGERECRCCCALLFLAYAWSAAPADWCGGLLPSWGGGCPRQPWERSEEALTHADPAITSFPASKNQSTGGNSPIFRGPVASPPLAALGLYGLQRLPGCLGAGREQRLASASEKLRSPRCTQPGRFSAGSDSDHSQARAVAPNCFHVF